MGACCGGVAPAPSSSLSLCFSHFFLVFFLCFIFFPVSCRFFQDGSSTHITRTHVIYIMVNHHHGVAIDSASASALHITHYYIFTNNNMASLLRLGTVCCSAYSSRIKLLEESCDFEKYFKSSTTTPFIEIKYKNIHIYNIVRRSTSEYEQGRRTYTLIPPITGINDGLGRVLIPAGSLFWLCSGASQP